MDFLMVDGSQGEGGGQILRTALAFAVIQGKPVRVTNIRAGRKVPGLRRQHVSTLEVLSQIFDGKLQGVFEGSTEIAFSPGKTRGERVSIDMGTAASITLVLQAVIPAAALSGSTVSLELSGGTDVPWSPTYDYLALVVREAYSRVGIVFATEALRRGYYPRGGGKVSATVKPCAGIRPLDLDSPPESHDIRVHSRCAGLPSHVAERQKDAALEGLRDGGFGANESSATTEDADSPGSSVLVRSVAEGEYLGSDSLGQRGRPAEDVGRSAADSMVRALRSGATLDGNLADMLLPLLSLAEGRSRAKVPAISTHLRTSLDIARQFTACTYKTEQTGGCWTVEVVPSGR